LMEEDAFQDYEEDNDGNKDAMAMDDAMDDEFSDVEEGELELVEDDALMLEGAMNTTSNIADDTDRSSLLTDRKAQAWALANEKLEEVEKQEERQITPPANGCGDSRGQGAKTKWAERVRTASQHQKTSDDPLDRVLPPRNPPRRVRRGGQGGEPRVHDQQPREPGGGNKPKQKRKREQWGQGAGDVVRSVCKMLNEQNVDLMKRIANEFGTEIVQMVAQKSLEKEEDGGMMTADGERRRKPGGVFMQLLSLEVSSEKLKPIFAANQKWKKENKKKKQKMSLNPDTGLPKEELLLK